MRSGKDVGSIVTLIALSLFVGGCSSGPVGQSVSPSPGPRVADAGAPGAGLRSPPPSSLRLTEPPQLGPAGGNSPVTLKPENRQADAQPPDRPGAVIPAANVRPAEPAEDPLRRVYRLASTEYGRIDSYIVRLTRREQVGGKDQPQEIIELAFRKEPFSVRFKWLDDTNKGRQALYVKGQYEGKLHTLLGPNDGNLLMKAGSHIALAPDSAMVRSRSRHMITEAGIGWLIDRFGEHVVANEKPGARKILTYLGPVKRDEFTSPVEGVEQVIAPGAEKDLPRGGKRLWLFGENHLPALVLATDDKGQLVEYYLHDRYLYPVKLGDDDFNPEKLWGK
jgi:Protein of unknown function (DUF1571)